MGEGSNPGPGPFLNPPPPQPPLDLHMHNCIQVAQYTMWSDSLKPTNTKQRGINLISQLPKHTSLVFVGKLFYTGVCRVVTNRQWYMYHDLMNDMVNTHYTLKIYIFNQIINWWLEKSACKYCITVPRCFHIMFYLIILYFKIL